jgi:hypothetical protein
MASQRDPPTYTSEVVGITVRNTTSAFLMRWGVSITFFPGWPRTMIFPIFTSQLAGITTMYYRIRQDLNASDTFGVKKPE